MNKWINEAVRKERRTLKWACHSSYCWPCLSIPSWPNSGPFLPAHLDLPTPEQLHPAALGLHLAVPPQQDLFTMFQRLVLPQLLLWWPWSCPLENISASMTFVRLWTLGDSCHTLCICSWEHPVLVSSNVSSWGHVQAVHDLGTLWGETARVGEAARCVSLCIYSSLVFHL